MSKSLGNTVLARELIDEFGGDAVRLFFLVGVPWKTRNIDRKFITEISRISHAAHSTIPWSGLWPRL